MSFQKTIALSALITAAGFAGCIEYGDPTGAGDEATSSVAQEVAYWRNDQSGILNPGIGHWGSWWPRAYCNPGSWAVGYRLRVEGSQGGGDDTALNSVELLCKNPVTGATEWISSYDGNWGTWRAAATCSGPGNFLNAARIRIESPQGGGDDTGATNVQFNCSKTGALTAPGGHTWGSWGGMAYCAEKSAVCGLAIRFEGSQAGGDDTAMNGLEVECCDVSCNSTCGDGLCDTSCETPTSCQRDCGSCNDGRCSEFESAWSCPGDCGYCGDGNCYGSETVWSCASDCASCGDGICSPGESYYACPFDCPGLPPCGVATCPGCPVEPCEQQE